MCIWSQPIPPGFDINIVTIITTCYVSSRATHVPVGDDQLQHLELARDIAKSFNSHYGFTFPDPQPLLGW